MDSIVFIKIQKEKKFVSYSTTLKTLQSTLIDLDALKCKTTTETIVKRRHSVLINHTKASPASFYRYISPSDPTFIFLTAHRYIYYICIGNIPQRYVQILVFFPLINSRIRCLQTFAVLYIILYRYRKVALASFVRNR